MEGKTYAKTSHVGGFGEIGKAHTAVIDWTRENNLKICGAPMEKYLTARRAVFNSSRFEIEVYYPIEN
jgi:effector-binding domain-containing protein